jgi:putative addiction module component (TIGR02574 family)
MSKLARKILEEAEMLPDDERAQVALKLLMPASGELTEAWREELQRRVAALEAGTTKTRAWQDVRADVLKMLAKR